MKIGQSIELLPLFDTFLIMLFIFMASANHSKFQAVRAEKEKLMAIETKLTTSQREHQNAVHHVGQLSRKLQDEQEQAKQHIRISKELRAEKLSLKKQVGEFTRDIKSLNADLEKERHLRVNAEVVSNKFTDRINNMLKERAGLRHRNDDLQSQVNRFSQEIKEAKHSLNATADRLIAERETRDIIEQKHENIIARTKMLERNKKIALKTLSEFFRSSEVTDELEKLLEQQDLDNNADKKIRQTFESYSAPEKILEKLFVLNKIASLYAPIDIYLTGNDYIKFMNNSDFPCSEASRLSNDLEDRLENYMQNNQGVSKFIFIVKFGDCTKGCMDAWREAFNLLK